MQPADKVENNTAAGRLIFLGEIPKVPDAGHYALSQAQMGNWLMNRFLPDPGPFNSWFTEEVPVLEPDLAVRAVMEVIRRHEIFRTTFGEIDGEPGQVVHPAEKFAGAVTKIKSPEKVADCVKALESEARDHRFDFRTGPLFYVKIVEAAGGFVVLFNMHHVLTDAWSNNIIRQEVYSAYQVLVSANADPLPEPPVQFRDFSAWHRALYTGMLPEAFRRYWFRFSGSRIPDSDLTELFSGSKRPSDSYEGELIAQLRAHLKPMEARYERMFLGVIGKVEMKESGVYYFAVPHGVLRRLKTLAGAGGFSLFQLLIGSLHLTVFHLTGNPDSVIGVNMAMRNNDALRNMIGFMVNTVLVRNLVQTGDSTLENLSRMAWDTMEAFDFGFYPFERVLKDLDLPFSAVSKIFVNMPNTTEDQMTFIRDFAGKHLEGGRHIGYFDLDLHIVEEKNGIKIYCEYKKHLFRPQQIAFWAEVWTELLRRIGEDAEQLPAELFAGLPTPPPDL